MDKRAPHAVRFGRSALVLGGEVGKDWSRGWLSLLELDGWI